MVLIFARQSIQAKSTHYKSHHLFPRIRGPMIDYVWRIAGSNKPTKMYESLEPISILSENFEGIQK